MAATSTDQQLPLLDLPQELQDEVGPIHHHTSPRAVNTNTLQIQEYTFSDSEPAIIDSNFRMPGLLRALRTNSDQGNFRNALEKYYKNTTFVMEVGEMSGFIKAAQPYVHHIQEIRLLPTDNPTPTRGYCHVEIETSMVSIGPNLVVPVNTVPWLFGKDSVLDQALVVREILDGVVDEMGLENKVLKGQIQVLDEGRVVKTVWCTMFEIFKRAEAELDRVNHVR